MTREKWGSRFGFIMATAGFAVGLGNVWRFSYVVGSNGGGAFLVVYLACSILIGIPLLSAEISLGRKAGLTPIAGMFKLTGGRTSGWNLIAWFGLAAAVLIMSYYMMLIGWVLAYFVKTALGQFRGVESFDAAFTGFVADSGQVFLYCIPIFIMSGLIVSGGVQKGVERVAKVLMPLLFVLLIALAIRSVSLPGSAEGLVWYLYPDFSKVDGAVILTALGQSFFSIGIGMAAAFGFGSYLSTDSDVTGNAAIVVAFDVTAALLAGFVIFPAIFAFGLEPDSGAGLVFVTMTNLFDQMPAGQWVGSLFFLLLMLAGVTSAVALLEVLVGTLIDLVGWTRRRAVWTILGGLGVASIPIVLSQGPWSHIQVAGMDLFVLIDTISGSYALPAGALALALYTSIVWGFDKFQQETNVGAGLVKVSVLWKPFVKFLIPAAVTLILLGGIGLL